MPFDFFTGVFYLITVLIIGICASKKINNLKDFALSKGNFSYSIMVATIFSTWIGGEDLIGVSERVYMHGIIFTFVLYAQFISLALHAYIIAPFTIREFYDAVSIGDIMCKIHGRNGQFITGIAVVLFSIGFISVQVSCLGNVCNEFFGISNFLGTVIGALIIILYSFGGGIRAVVWTDFFQFGVLIIGIPVIASVALLHVGGLEQLIQKVPPKLLTFNVDKNVFWEYMCITIAGAVPYFNPILIQRILMSKNIKQAKESLLISGALYVPFYALVTLIGLCALVLFPNIVPGNSFLTIVNTLVPPALKGITLIAILAVIMSTADSHLNVAAISISRDVIEVLSNKKLSDKTELLILRLSTVVIGMVAIFVATRFDNKMDFWLYFSNFWTPTVVAPMILYMIGVVLSGRQYLFSILLGGISIILYRSLVPNEFDPISHVIGMLVTVFTGCIISVFINKKSISLFKTKKLKSDKLSFFSNILHKINEFFSRCSLENLVKYSNDSVREYGARYVAFGAFSIINYMTPFYMWSENNASDFSVVTIRIIAGILSFLLVVSDSCTQSLKKYLPLFWHFTIMFCLPFLTVYMLLFEGATTFWVTNITIAAILCLILVDIKTCLVIFPLGSLLAFLTMKLLGNTIVFNGISFYSLYLFVFATAIVIIFALDKENIAKSKLNIVKLFAGSLIHELRTPLAIISLNLKNIEKNIAKFSDDAVITEKIRNQLLSSIQMSNKECFKVSDYISLVAMNLKMDDIQINSKIEEIDAFNFVKNVVGKYPHKTEEDAAKIILNLEHNFTFHANEEIMTYVLYNIIQNAFYQIASAGKGEIFINVKDSFGNNVISVKDTANGIDKKRISEIFKLFVSFTNGGIGIGLPFCKKAVEDIGAELICNSEKGQFAEFSIIFPNKNF